MPTASDPPAASTTAVPRLSGEANFPVEDDDTGPGSGAATPTGKPIGESPESSTPELSESEQAKVLDLSDFSPADLERLDSDVIRAIAIFFSNDFDGALAVMKSKSESDALFALGEGTFSMLKAMTTFDMEDIATATALLQRAEALAAAQLKLAAPKSSANRFSKWIKGGASFIAQSTGLSSAPRLTPAQIRSTIVRAEASLISSFLYLFQESLMAFVKAGLGLRKSQGNYATAWQNYQAWAKEFEAAGGDQSKEFSDKMDLNTREGVQFGIGALNVVLSILPSKVARLISLFGYKGDKSLGFELLEKACATSGVRAPIAQLFMGGYNAVLSSFAPTVLGPTMLPLASRHLVHSLSIYPTSPFHLLLTARVARSARNLDLSNTLLERAIQHTPATWPEIAMLCKYERSMNAMGQLDWAKAAEMCAELRKRTYWSPAFFAYSEAVALAMVPPTDKARDKVVKLAAEAKGLVTRKYGGKVISVEQWVIKKADWVEESKGDGVCETLPGFELLFIWNMFATMAPAHLDQVAAQVSDALDAFASESNANVLAILYVVLAAVEKERHNWEAANRAMEWIREHEEEIDVETWVAPMAAYLQGVVGLSEVLERARAGSGEPVDLKAAVKEALVWMGKAAKYSDFVFEFRLAFRIHLVTIQLEEWLRADSLTIDMFHLPTSSELFPPEFSP
ncbi:hypothetical protein BCR44DRAFT_144802 [Catenaria anguillulae PL171]|uniref:Uncharacterized protein n=1 Tax=Catenaria anguillulae PL171 TaxID=765915 RepID=A0A1Y2HHH0_9FUNG|nr:hypothetical protein BCR44DRAFT_144802 [Catenaria anguillulae PL171]